MEKIKRKSTQNKATRRFRIAHVSRPVISFSFFLALLEVSKKTN